MQLLVPVSVGELLDKISILEIKSRKISDAAKRENVQRELELLEGVWAEANQEEDPKVTDLRESLREVNERLWEIEDAIRDKEAQSRFDGEFVELARSVYITNDRRAAIKRRLNELLGSHLVEEKSYATYDSSRSDRAEEAGTG